MHLPENYVFVTSMNTRLYNHPHNLFTTNVPHTFPNHKTLFYHENSFDSKHYNQSIDLNDFNNKPNVKLIDLFEESDWLEEFLMTSPFKDCYKSNDYYLKNSPFWFRKVVAICSAISQLENGTVMVWADCDSFISKNIPESFYEYFENYDWLVILRHKDWIESGFQFIKINDKTKEFAKFYLDFYLSGRAFTQEPQWADNWILEACFRDYEGELTTGGLTPFFGCPIDINDFIRHSKSPLRQVRDKQKI